MPLINDEYKYEHPNFPGRFVSRQRIYQLRMRANGRCPRCGKRRGKGKDGFCKKCDQIEYGVRKLRKLDS